MRMIDEHIYTTGEFARKADVSVRTIRYYDKQEILKPSHISESGYRLYTDGDFAKLQKILTLKYLGFSLDEIQEISMKDTDKDYVQNSLKLQLELVKKKIESLQLVEESLKETSRMIGKSKDVDWKNILHLIHLIDMEKSLAEQYRTGANTSARIRLHRDYSVNSEGWFTWLYRQLDLKEQMKVLELGAGNGELWKENWGKLPKIGELLLSDVSAGMMQDAREQLDRKNFDTKRDSVSSEMKNQTGIISEGDPTEESEQKEKSNQQKNYKISYEVFDCHHIPKADHMYDRVTANHVLFYLKDMDQALSEVRRVMKDDGMFICSTYSTRHMHEIPELARAFDSQISLSEVPLPEVFGLENGEEILKKYFRHVELIHYPDALEVTEAQPIIDYILSCHGNQQEFIQGRYEEFRQFIQKKLEKTGAFHITKDAGVFRCWE